MPTPTPTPHNPPNESTADIFTERTLMAGDFISGVGYGIQLVLYIRCTMFLIRQRKDRKYSMHICAYITLLLTLETTFCVVWARMVEVMYIDNRNYSGGPLQWFADSQHHPMSLVYCASLFLLTFLSDLLVLWRCWVIWTASGKYQAYLAILLPIFVLLASFVVGTLWILQYTKPGVPLYSELSIAYGIAYYATSVGLNIALTLLITFRLWWYRRNLISRLPKEFGKHYVSLATTIVESAALYSLFALLFLITYAINNPIHQVFLAVAQFTQQISAYLIIYRVANGSAFNNTTLTTQITTINFANPPQTDGAARNTIQLPILPPPPPRSFTPHIYNPQRGHRDRHWSLP